MFSFKQTLCLIILLTCSLYAAQLPETAAMLPGDIVFLAEINDTDQLIENFNRTSMGKLYHDPAMSKFIEKIWTGIKEKDFEDESLRYIFDKSVFPKGRIAVAAGQDINNAMLFVQWKDNLQEFKTLIDKVNEDHSGKIKTEQYRDVEVTTIITQSEKAGQGTEDDRDSDGVSPVKGSRINKYHYCFIEDFFIFSSSQEMMQFAIAHAKGAGSETFKQNQSYKSFKQSFASGSDMSMFVDLKVLMNKAKQQLTQANPDSMKYYDILGLDGLSSFTAAVTLAGEQQVDYSARIMIGTDGTRSGLLKMFELENAEFRPPSFITDRYSSVSYLNWNVNKAFDELFRMLSGIQPMFAAMLNSPLTPPGPDGSGGIILKRDIISHIGSQVVIGEVVNKDNPLNTFPLIAVAVNDKNALEGSLSTLHSMFLSGGNPDMKRQFLGHNIYSINLSSMIMGDNSDMMSNDKQAIDEALKISFSITDSHLILGTESMVEQALRSLADKDAASVASTGWYRRARSLMPDSSCMGSAMDSNSSWKQLWTIIKKGGFKDFIASEADVTIDDQDISDVLDFSLLPDFEQVSRYFGLTLYYGLTKPEGFYMEVKKLKNKSL